MTGYKPEDLEAAFPRFATFRLLGMGGEGAVFSVWDRVRKEDLALKLMRDHGELDLGERFESEYAILATSRSNRLVTVYQHGQCRVRMADGKAHRHYWYTMEKCESSVRTSYRRMQFAQRVDVSLQMIDGIAFLHAKNIAHRDIKPDNLFLVLGTQVKIGDFGLATLSKVVTTPSGPGGVVTGSPPYLAPERWTGDQDADWRPSDQYAAGISLFELLTAGGAALDFREGYLQAHQKGAVQKLIIPELRGRPLPSVDRVVARMLAKRPTRRYSDIAECKRELTAALAQDGMGADWG